jgi:hypothetical protein
MKVPGSGVVVVNDVPMVRSSIPKTSPSVVNVFSIWMAVILCEGSVLATPKKNTLALVLLVVRFGGH